MEKRCKIGTVSAVLKRRFCRSSMVLSAVKLDILTVLNLDLEVSPCWSTENDAGSKTGAAGVRIEEHLNRDCAVFGGAGIEFGSPPAYRDSGGGLFTSFVTAELRLKSLVQASRSTSSTKKGSLPFF